MRICQVGPGTLPIPSGGAGGVENTVHHSSVALMELGHRVTVIDVPNPGRSPPPYELVEAGPLWPRFSNLPERALRGLTFQFAVWRVLRRLLLEREFDVIHFHGQLGAGMNVRLKHGGGILNVFGCHNATWGDENSCRSRRLKAKFFWEMDALRAADGVICDSATMRVNLIRFFGIPESKVLNIPIGVDEETLASQPVGDSLRASCRPNGSQMILNVARLAPYKDQLTLVRAMALVHQQQPQARLCLIGPCTDTSYVRKVAREVKLLGLEKRVMLLGEVPRSELLQLYELCDVFVLSSINEAQGLSVLEAMAKAKPVVATAIGPVLEILPADGGVVVPPQEPERMASAILEVLWNPARGQETGQRARCHALKSYQWRTIAQRTIHAYESFRKGGTSNGNSF